MFRATGALGMRYTGSSLETLGERAGQGYRNTVDAASRSIEQRFPTVTEAKIQGTTPHTSAKDPLETNKIVTIGFYTEKGTRALSIHAREDGTWKEFFSRAGASKGSDSQK